MVNTVKVIDALLKIDTPVGPTWRRYNDDGYGEHEDGSPFDGTGIGRGWPLLTGERAHYELAAGHLDEAQRLRQAMAAFANAGGMLPEQVWDGPDLPDKELFSGQASGSAMPLVWAHAEYVKLCRSLAEGRVFDLPPQPVQRYQIERVGSPYVLWRFNHKCRTIPTGQTLRLELPALALIHWSVDGWNTTSDQKTHDTGLGLHLADLPTAELAAGTTIIFTFYWLDDERWAGEDFTVAVTSYHDKLPNLSSPPENGVAVDIVDEAGLESFPASDPPVWTRGYTIPG